MKVVIIGSAAAGVSAAQKIVKGDKTARIVVYEKTPFFSCGSCGLPHYLGHPESNLEEAIQRKAGELLNEGVEAKVNHEAVSIDPVRKQVTLRNLENGQTFVDVYDKLVVATGSNNLIPQVPGAEKMGVHVLKSVGDLIFLKEFIKTPYVHNIAILGGSFAGLEIAKAFLRRGRSVRIIEKESKLLPAFDKEVSDMIQAELEARGVQICLGETVRSFTGRTYIEKVQTNKGNYDCDLTVVAIGVRPNTDLLAAIGAELSSDGSVLIDNEMQTSITDIYAVGDCARKREKGLDSSSLKMEDLEIARTGLTEAEAKQLGIPVKSVIASANDRPGICPNPSLITIKLVYDAGNRRILGAQAWGRKHIADRINAIAVAIEAGMTPEQLGKIDFVYSSFSSSIWDPIQVVCNQAL
ncbi:MAG: FAD-dependent oxidoreductase [Lachnospiraceae bacterium]|jgi:NADPH-dependent 2,4-dienoyl-CoA reductase/sulfur reductase-like enzyme